MNSAHRRVYEHTMRASPCWLGVPVRKNPLDLWALQDLVYRLRPQLILECGSGLGGSAYFYAALMDLLNFGAVVTIDNDSTWMRPAHSRITYVAGSSTDRAIVEAARHHCEGKPSVMVILDSDHRAEHVAAELAAYAPLVTPGSYLVVEDTNINGHPVLPEFGPGPAEAVAAFLMSAAGADFRVDSAVEPPLSFNPSGYLQRVR